MRVDDVAGNVRQSCQELHRRSSGFRCFAHSVEHGRDVLFAAEILDDDASKRAGWISAFAAAVVAPLCSGAIFNLKENLKSSLSYVSFQN